MNKENKIVVFQDKGIRRIWHNEEWYFSVVDVIEALTDSANPRNYWNMMKSRELEHEVELYTNCVQLKLEAPDGKLRLTDCANTKSMLRIVQSIPSKKAEPFKVWLAKVGYDRIQEIENPELAQERAKRYYELKGYPQDCWFDLVILVVFIVSFSSIVFVGLGRLSWLAREERLLRLFSRV